MAVIILYMLIMLALICESEIVSEGAYEGLMLWFNSVLPLLLPFMLLSSMIVDRINKLPKDRQKSFAILITLFTGLFCGYPLGAKNSAEFVRKNIYSKRTGELLLPLCNNCSPMFLSGYIILSILKNRISLLHALFFIYVPYIIYIIIIILSDIIFNPHKINAEKISTNTISDLNESETSYKLRNDNDFVMQTVIQITYVGFYIILCSIISNFIMSVNTDYAKTKVILSGITEITKGTKLIYDCSLFDFKTKTALVLSLSSFGGISSILQTESVIKKSDLSVIKYIITKAICALATYGLVLLFI